MPNPKDSQSQIKMLPHDDGAEKAILGTLLLNSDYWDKVSQIIEDKDFYHPANQVIFASLFALKNEENKESFDAMILIDYLNRKKILDKAGGISYIAELTNNTIIAQNVETYCDIIKEHSKRRLLFKMSQNLQETVFDPSLDVDETLEQSAKSLNDALLSGLKDNSEEYNIGTIVSKTVESITKKMSGEEKDDRVATGYDYLDKYTNGGFNKEEYIIIAARPSIGKTAFALSMMYNMIRSNKKVAFFSLEMPSKAIAQRLLAIDSKIDLTKIIRADFMDEEFEALQASAARLYDKRENLYIIDVPNISLTELRTKARILCKEKKIDCIVIDYIGLISVPSYYQNQRRFEQVSLISLSLKQLARELKVPVVVLCQVGRESEAQEPLLSNLRDSGSIEQDADVVCFLHRKKTLSEEEKQKNVKDSAGRAVIQVTKMIVAKNRNGQTGWFKLGYNGPLTHYADIAQESEFIDYPPSQIPSGKKN